MWLFSKLFNKKNNNVGSQTVSDEYNDTVLLNGNTIREQKEIGLKMAGGIYPSGTPDYLGMRIVSNTVPPIKDYNVLNKQEKKFFKIFHDQLLKEKFSPSKIKLTRLSNGCFNVDYIGLCYIGKINLYEKPTQYSVIKEGNKRPTKNFPSLQEATQFIAGRSEYTILEKRESTYMQYFIGSSDAKEVFGLNADQYAEYIFRWIRYIKYCKRN